MDGAWLFLVSRIKVPNMPLTLCHSGLMDKDVLLCVPENRHPVHPSFTQHSSGTRLAFGGLVSAVNITTFYESADIMETDLTYTPISHNCQTSYRISVVAEW